jgi:regulatory protein
MHGTITDILPQERSRGKRFNVFVDHRYGFSLQADVAIALRVGQAVSDTDVDQLLESDERQRALDAALVFLSYRPRSEQEVQRRLAKKFPPATNGWPFALGARAS